MTELSKNANAATQLLVFSSDPNPLRVLAQYPPFIVGYKSLPSNVAGINRNMVNSDRRGLLGYIFPYMNMEATDKIRLFLKEDARPIPLGDIFAVGDYVNQPVPFHLPAEILQREFAQPVPVPQVRQLYYEVERLSGNQETSPSLPLLYKPFGPGEEDNRLDLPNNQGLALPIPSETVIDKNVLDKGMYVTVRQYQYQAVGDLVYLMFGPRQLSQTVTRIGDLLFELTPALLSSLPNTNKVVIAYEIVDIVENDSGWSSPVVLDLKPTEMLLTAPVIDEASPGNPDDLRHDQLSGATATVLLNEQFADGDLVTLKMVLNTAAGDRLERITEINVNRNTRSLSVDLENGFVRNGIRGSLTLSYTRQRAATLSSSKSYIATISGISLPAAAPTIDEQQDGKLPADTSLAHIRIPTYWPLVNNATVQLYWQVVGSDGVTHLYIFAQIIVDASQPVVFTVPAEYIGRFESSALTTLYKIENPGTPVVQSESLSITIGAAAQLPAPELLQALPGNRVQPLDTREAATVRVHDPAMNSSKRYTLTVTGRPGFGSPVLSPQQGNSSGEILFNLPATAIPANIATDVTFSCSVSESGKPDRRSGLRRYRVLDVANPQINYPRMNIKEATDDKVLNLNSFSGDAHWSLPAYLFIAVGTQLRVALSGNESSHVILLFDGTITADHVRNGLAGTINREQLKLFTDGSQVFGLSIANFSDRAGVDAFFPMLELTIKTQSLVRPAITQLIDNNGAITGQVVNGGSCDDPTPQLIGTGSPNSSVLIYRNDIELLSVPVGPDGIWRMNIDVGFGTHALTAKTPGGGQTSNTWTVTIKADLDDRALGADPQNKWIVGNAAMPDGYFQQNMWGFIFLTHTSSAVNHAGILLYKELAVTPGTTYRFCAELFNWSATGLYDPSMDLAIMDNTLRQTGPFTPLRDSTPYLLQMQFTAVTSKATFYIRSLRNLTNGNDMAIRNIRVQQLSNGTGR
ncbi:hypothetical protein [Pseudomonas sp. NPDC089741]|uniref:hypothetical protein n=1 Tax=Pseudomonas sp. NPDC089741 TaxID=3364470 RepID=UPI0037FC39A0